MNAAPGSRSRGRRRLLWVYLLLLAASHLVRGLRGPTDIPAALSVAHVPVVDEDSSGPERVRLTYRDSGGPAPAVVLLHGSPGSSRDFGSAAPALEAEFRVIVPDLPGFGHSEQAVPDYSTRAHARYVLALLDELGLERAHWVGYSMGGGVAIDAARLAPGRVRSLTLLSALGVQEFELLGSYELNHGLHALLLGAAWFFQEAVPHFGLLEGGFSPRAFARNFFDTDQRPLREALEEYDGPAFVLHGEADALVPVEAAREHARLLPQAKLEVVDDGHLMLFTDGPATGERLRGFLREVEAGSAPVRAEADPVRRAAAAVPLEGLELPPWEGMALVLAMLFLAGATWVSEDLTCIGAGALVAQGRIELAPAALACFVGIYSGDVLLFLLGRFVGRSILHRAPLSWFLNERDVESSSRWFSERGAAVIGISRFLPGARLPTYFAAGLLRTSFTRFALLFAFFAAIWTPILVWSSAALGTEIIESVQWMDEHRWLALAVTVGALFVLLKVALPLFSHRGRRLLLGRWRRWTRWEFWPPWCFYPPVVAYVLYLAARHRSLFVFTSANPAIPAGGFIGESKAEILSGLAGAGDAVARWTLVPATGDRLGAARSFLAEAGLSWPVVLKPDVGQRGDGVAIVSDESELARALDENRGTMILQEFVDGPEFGVFWVRHPEAERGRVFAVTRKTLPTVEGDGERTLEELILDDDRAVCAARTYLRANATRLYDVPEAGERVRIASLGTHCLGAVFSEGQDLLTPALEAEVERVSRTYDGFSFGRYDVRAASEDAFRAGEFRVIELNGVTSEATNIYDARYSVLDAYRVLFEQWRLAFEIGAACRERGHEPAGVMDLVRQYWRWRRRAGA